MRVTAALSWWNEDPAVLEACVRSAAGVADRIIAIDGAYARYPGATITSSAEQAEAIRSAGLPCEIIVPDRLWRGQCEKRTALMQRAAEGSDWVLVLDADWVLHANGDGVRDELARSVSDVFEVPFVNPPNPQSSLAPSRWHQDQLARSESHPVLYRALPGFQVERLHYYVSAMKGAERIWLQSDGPQDYADPPTPHSGTSYRTAVRALLTSECWIEHRWAWRSDDAKLREREYENDRWKVFHLTGQEDDQEGLPAPDYDSEEFPV